MSFVNSDTLTERINHICYKLEHYAFLSKSDKEKLLLELNHLIERRNNLQTTLK